MSAIRLLAAVLFVSLAQCCWAAAHAGDLTSAVISADSSSAPPTVTLTFDNNSVPVGITEQFQITLTNTNPSSATLLSNLSIDLPPSFSVTNPGPGGPVYTSCTGGSLSAEDGSGSLTLTKGVVIPPGGSCYISGSMESWVAGEYQSTIPANSFQTNLGSNIAFTSAQIAVTGIPLRVEGTALPGSAHQGQVSILMYTLINPNSTAATISGDENLLLVDSDVTGDLSFDGDASTTCPNGVAQVEQAPGFGFLTLKYGAMIPANSSCTVSVPVVSPTVGTYTFPATEITTDIGGSILGDSFSLEVTSASPGYVATAPARLLDTRLGTSTVDLQFSGVGALHSGETLDLPVLGRGGVPTSNVSAVLLNLTATNPSANGYITAWPSGSSLPLSSNINFVPGLTIPNLVVVPVGINGSVSLFNSAGTTDLVADVVGYILSGSPVEATTPARLLDTRVGGKTIDGQFAGIGAVPAGGKIDLGILNRGSAPASLAAALLNVTVTNTTKPGFITAFASGTPQPLASNLNFIAGQTIANLVVAPIGSDGKVSLYNSAGTTDVVADLVGIAPVGSQLNTVAPARLMDTRSGGVTIDGQYSGGGPLTAGGSINLNVAGRGGLPRGAFDAVILNVTVTNPTAAGYLTIWPLNDPFPLASNLNFTAGVTVPNLVISRVSVGAISIFNSAGNTDVVVDVVGWFSTLP